MPTIQKTLRVYNFIERVIASNGEPPTLREICTQFNFNAPSAAHQHLDKMIERGWIRRIPHVSRGVRLTGNGPKPPQKVKCPICELDLDEGEFGKCRARKSGRNLYCKSCIRAKVSVHRASIRAMKAARKALTTVERKPNVLSKRNAFSLVYNAIIEGYRTRESIQRHTKLDYDSIGDALTELLFEAKGIVIHNREYVPIEELLVRKEAA